MGLKVQIIMANKIGFVETPLEIAKLMVKLSALPKNISVLDAGCGRGVFLQALKDNGYTNVCGIEIDRGLYGLCNRNFGSHFRIVSGDFLTYDFNQKFDLIIGNPPYVHFNQLPQSNRNTVKRIIKTSEGDIYYAFIIKSILLLKDGGELIYIVPYHFFYNTYAKIVRENFLRFGKIEILFDLDETHLFNNENPETIIFKFKKGKYNIENEKIKLLNIKTRKTSSLEIYKKAFESLENKSSNELFDYIEFPHYLNPAPWSSFIVNIPDFPSVKLIDIAKVGVGLVSGFDEAFIIDEEENKDLKFGSCERKLIKKFVKGKQCRRFIVDDCTLYIVIDDSIKTEDEIREKYPNIYLKIMPYKDRASNRYLPKNKKWFHWQALRNYNFLANSLNKRRIYIPTLDRHSYNRFSLGEEYLFPSGDVLFIQPYKEDDLYFLLGYLNSTFFRKYYLSKGGRRGGRVSFTQRLLENVEIPLFSHNIIERIKYLIKIIINKLEKNEDTSALEKELDNLIYSAIEKGEFNVEKMGIKSETYIKSKITLNQWLG